ncbi:unnamed protein product [Pleuronectes platessa]|uniref:DUF6729 domain-containing protein n=1 Tax=Pleuronectes platessa TaxID=8262 RepID=A0A9N7W3L2_PLEPL|nr:unnamed protein product [Pleuronectes platessa]
MDDEEWMSRLRRFAAVGVWPADAGNRPAPRQKKWHDLFLKIEKCPMQLRGQRSLFGGTQTSNCGFHIKKPSVSVSSSVTPQPGPSSGSPSITPGQPPRKPTLTLASFTKPRFGGSHGAHAQPNLASAGQRGIKLRRRDARKVLMWQRICTFRRRLFPKKLEAGRTPSLRRCGGESARGAVAPGALPSAVPGRLLPQPRHMPSGLTTNTNVQTSANDIDHNWHPVTWPQSQALYSDCLSSVSSTLYRVYNHLHFLCHIGCYWSSHPTPDPEPLAAHLMSAAAVAASQPGWLPAKLRQTIPPQDQKWIAAALWKHKRLRSDLTLWYAPPLPAIIYHQVPAPERFFTHRLLLWMLYHLWNVRLSCPACRKQLTGYGAHKRARKVLDVDTFYLMITETLWCSACKTAYISSSKTILDQLEMPIRMEFTPILTQRYACDIRVIVHLRDRTLGNSPSRLVRQLRENHSREWIRFLIRVSHGRVVSGEGPD